jgi:acetolactate synthase-1/2/3 large subunit
MGFGFPAAIGAGMAEPGVRSVVIAGDGGFQMTAQELATLKMYDVRNVKICIINNSFLGMVRQWQEMFHGKRYSEVWLGDSNPDFIKLADAYGVPGYRASSAEELPAAIDAWLADPNSALLEVVVPHEHAVFPMVPAGAALYEMLETEPARTPGPDMAEVAEEARNA